MTARIKPGENLQTFSAGVYKVRPDDESRFEEYCDKNNIVIEKKTKITNKMHTYRICVNNFTTYKQLREAFGNIEKPGFATLDASSSHARPLQFAWRKGDFCVRACPEHLVYFDDKDEHVPIDFIKFDKNGEREYIRNIRYFYFDISETCWELKFQGSCFKEIQKNYANDLWEMLGKAYDTLTEWHENLPNHISK